MTDIDETTSEPTGSPGTSLADLMFEGMALTAKAEVADAEARLLEAQLRIWNELKQQGQTIYAVDRRRLNVRFGLHLTFACLFGVFLAVLLQHLAIVPSVQSWALWAAVHQVGGL